MRERVASVCDILTRPAPELNTEERTEVKKVARELLMRLKQLLVLNWRQKAAARSALRLFGFRASLTESLRTGLPQNEAKSGGDLFAHLYRSQCRASTARGPPRVTSLSVLRRPPLKAVTRVRIP